MRRNGISHCYFTLLCFGFHEEKFSEDHQREVKQFLLNQNKHNLYKHLEDDHWIAKLAYMADVFEHMNELNIKIQGISENILTCSDKLHGFQKELQLWQNELKLRSLEMFPRSYKN